jgi:hypothetical protein
MRGPDMPERVRVREVAGIFALNAAADSAVDELLHWRFDGADTDTVAGSGRLRGRIGDILIPAVDLADIPSALRQEFVVPDNTAGIFILCAAIMGCLGAMAGALTVAGLGVATAWTLTAAVVGAAGGFGFGGLIAQSLGCRW